MDIGDYGSQLDGAVFKASKLGQQFIDGEFDLPWVGQNTSLTTGGPEPGA